MIDKFCDTVHAALAGIKDGDTVLLGGFGTVGQPNGLIRGLMDMDVKELTVIANNAGFGKTGLPELIAAGQVRKMICSFPRGSDEFEQRYAQKKIELEIVPQGTLAERIRAGGAGIPAFYTPTTVGTILAEGKEHREFKGRTYVLEHGIEADYALIEAWESDPWGNLTYRGTGQNFNPVMATAARVTVVQVSHRRALGEIDPKDVRTPGIYVHRVVHLPLEASIVTAVRKTAKL